MNRIFYIFLVFALLFLVSCKEEFFPVCLITFPQEEQEFYDNEDIQVAVTATGGNSPVAYIHLYIDDVGYGSVSSAPYEFTIKAGEITAGVHTLKVIVKSNDGKSRTTSVRITVKETEIDHESPDSVTFSDGELPKGWETNGWCIPTGGYGGYDDIYSMFTKTPGATVTATKTCKDILFYMRGAGIVNFYLDGTLLCEIKVENKGWDGGLQGWQAYFFSFKESLHSFTWEYFDKLEYSNIHSGVNLDAVKFKQR